jgi:sugar phosphate isomerase/epimerase
MLPEHNIFALFVKAWKHLSIPELARRVRSLGFEWIELPVRPGFPCTPENVETSLPEAVRVLGAEGVRVLNVTAANALDDERFYAASARAGVTLNRVMFERAPEENYWQAEARARRALDSALPLLARYGCRVGVQNHSGFFLPANAMGLHQLLKDYDPTLVGAMWDPAHNALVGEDPEPAVDIAWPYIYVVNLKNGLWRRAPTGGPAARWEIAWVQGAEGLASWERVEAKLRAMQYTGPFCFSADYTEFDQTERFIAADVAYARQVFGRGPNASLA